MVIKITPVTIEVECYCGEKFYTLYKDDEKIKRCPKCGQQFELPGLLAYPPGNKSIIEHQKELMDGQALADEERIKQLEEENEMLKTAVQCADGVFKKFAKQIDGILDDAARDQVFCVFETIEALQESE